MNKRYLEIPFALFAQFKLGGPLEEIEGTYKEDPELEKKSKMYKGKKIGFAIFEPAKPPLQQTEIPTYNLKMYQAEMPDMESIMNKIKGLEDIIEEVKELVNTLKSKVASLEQPEDDGSQQG